MIAEMSSIGLGLVFKIDTKEMRQMLGIPGIGLLDCMCVCALTFTKHT